MNAMLPEDCDDLIARYLDVCNQALALNGNRFPFKQILGAAKASERDRVIELDVVDTNPKKSYVMNIEKGKVIAAPHGDCGDCNCDRVWHVTRDYLEDVAGNPEVYVQNPAKIDWGWMYDVPQGGG